jgi:hypothetical protein
LAELLAPSPTEPPSDVRPPETAELLAKEPKEDKEEPNQGPRNVLAIPAELWDKKHEAILGFMEDELSAAESERSPMMAKFSRWREAYIAPLAEGPKNFPIHNSSNITVAIIKEHVHTIAGQIVQSTYGGDQKFALKDLAAEWEPFVDNLERFMNIAAERDLNYEEAGIMAVIEMCILGTSVVEVPYEVDERSIYRYTADGRRTFKTTMIMQDGPVVNHVPIGSFWIRMHERDPQKARWVAKRVLLSELELRERESQGKFFGVDKIFEYYRDLWVQEAEDKEHEDDILDQKAYLPSRFEVFEIYLSFDMDDDNRFEELRLYFHRPSRLFIGRQFLPYWSGLRGFVKKGYFPRTDRFYDEGLAEMLEQIQIAVSAIANRRADNATLANLKMIIKRKILKNLQPGDPLYPGKMIEVNDVWNDIREFSMSDIYPSTISEEQILRGTAERLSGINEAAQGAAMPVSRTTAAAQLALLQEQRNRIGLTVSAIRKAQRKIGQIAFWHYSQFGTNSKGLLWMGEEGREVDQIFRMPRRVKELIQAIRISPPTSGQNQAVKRENAVGMFNLLTQMYGQLLPIAQGLPPEAFTAVLRSMVTSARRFMGDVLESFETSDPEAVLEGLVTLERLLPAPENLGGMEAFDRRAQSAESLDKLSRLEALLREAERVRSGQPGISPGDKPSRRTAPPERPIGGDSEGLIFGGESLFTPQ